MISERMTAEQYQAMRSGKKSKYRNTPTEYSGRKYASKKEARYAAVLDAMKISCEIKDWIPQVSVPINQELSTRYIVDFLVINLDDTYRWIDVKGKDTPQSKMKRKSVKESYGIDIELA